MSRYYLRLAGSVLGSDPRWHAENFVRQPMGQILAAIEWLNEHEVETANRDSHTTARLAAIVLSGLSMGKIEADHRAFLPYAQSALPPEVVRTIGDLIKSRRLPMSVVGILADDIRHTWKKKS